jgi:hypothetical protein
MPMDEALLETMQRQVAEQCEFALMALTSVNGCLERMSDRTVMRDHEARDATMAELWFLSHAFLTATANIAKHLWPRRLGKRKVESDQAFPERGEELRRSLDVPDDSPLDSRTLRNHFEHADERLEEWWLDNPKHSIVRRMIGPIDQVIAGEGENVTRHEWFDPRSERPVLSFLGDEIELRPIADALVALKESAARVTDPHATHQRVMARERAIRRRTADAGYAVATELTIDRPADRLPRDN